MSTAPTSARNRDPCSPSTKPVVERQRQLAHGAHRQRPVDHPGRLLDRPDGEDPGLAGIEDRGAGVDAEHPHVRDRERAAGEVGRRGAAGPGRGGQVVQGAGELTQRERVGVADRRHEQAARRGCGDPEPHAVVEDDLAGGLVPPRVEHRRAPQREADGLGDERERAQRHVGVLAGGPQPVAQRHRRGDVDGEELRDVRRGEGARDHRRGGRPTDAADRLAPGSGLGGRRGGGARRRRG